MVVPHSVDIIETKYFDFRAYSHVSSFLED